MAALESRAGAFRLIVPFAAARVVPGGSSPARLSGLMCGFARIGFSLRSV
jgi:hypothetical protein